MRKNDENRKPWKRMLSGFRTGTDAIRRGLCLSVLLLSTLGASAQAVKIGGTVRDEKGEPLPGVSVMVKGTTTGTTTDGKGEYTINAPGAGTRQFLYIGYMVQDQEIRNRNRIDVTMYEDAQQLDEVVVVGYGTQRKRDLTGAIVSVSADKIKERPYSNVMQSLAGQLPGVQITSTQGAPGMAPNIKVRGTSTINAGSNPLYVVDGVPLEDMGSETTSDSNLGGNTNPLNTINPADIESVEILKDASSAAIYGSRGANGVVLITTKQGKVGQTRVEASYELGVSEVARRIDVMNAPEWIEFETAARQNTLATELRKNPNYTSDLQKSVVPVEFSDPEWLARIGTGTDWQDVLFRTGITHNFRASVSGGNEKTQFMASTGYLNTKGVVDQNKYNRLTLRSNLRHKISRHFNMGLNMSFARMNDASFGTAGKSDVVSLAVQSDPIFPLYNENGNLGFKDPNSIWNTFQKYGFQLWHPYSLTREMDKNRVTNNASAVAFLEWNILDGLALKTSISGNIDEARYHSYWNDGQKWGYSGYVPAEGKSVTKSVFNWVSETTLNYNKIFGDHAVTGLLGYTAQEQRIDNGSMAAGSFPNDMVHTLNAGKIKSGSTDASEWAMISYLARATYSYKGKYLMSAAIRADGCSRFGANNRWGYFPSASVGWRISEEKFMEDLRWMDNLKLRASFGVTGNNQIPNYGAIGTLGYASYAFDNVTSQGLYVNTYPDENLKWEKTRQFDVGLDISLFNQRVNITYDYYYSRTVDMLLNVPIPAITGFTKTLTNIGELENQGMELSVNTRNIVGKFTWTTDFNISGNRNKVLKLGPANDPIIDNVNSAMLKTEVGQPIGNFYGYIFDGVIMSEKELTQYPVWPGSEAGDPRVRDVDGSGSIDEKDRTIIGNYQPDFTWGMTNTFTWKGWELAVMINGVHGNEIMNQQARFSKGHNGSRNAYKMVTGFWKSESEPGNGQIFKPRVVQNTVQAQSSSYWVEDGSFVRIKNIRLGYTFPQKWSRRLGIASLKIYANVENLHVFSDYPNFDPEGSTFQTGRKVGLDYGTYPNPRVWSVGINFNF